jgi:glycosyltransferase involved in cell wall biosynthesis
MPKTVIVVPCYNEADRLDFAAFRPLLADPEIHIVFVDDGSLDGTHAKLLQLRHECGDRIEVIRLTPNQGKAEAVRQGMRLGLSHGGDVVGYLDADLSTPATEMCRLVRVLRESTASAVLGARVRMLGYSIEREASRHYLGRLFATIASLALQLHVYDTQCGAKAFRDTPALRCALEHRFRSRWAFDVELIGRLLAPPANVAGLSPSDFLEVPLLTWTHVPGSKLKPVGMMRAGLEVTAIALRRRHHV